MSRPIPKRGPAPLVAAPGSPWRNRIVEQGEIDPHLLLANPKNWRIHPRNQSEALLAVLRRIGIVQTVVINVAPNEYGEKAYVVVDGHLRATLALADNQPTLPYNGVDLTEAEEAEVLLLLDPLAGLAGVDKAKLAELLASVAPPEAALQAVAQSLRERNKLVAGLARDGDEEDPDAAAPDAPTRTATGEIWTLGPHRLIVGDSTDLATWTALMAGARASLALFSPPYNVARNSSLPYKDKYHLGAGAPDDAQDPAAYLGLLSGLLAGALAHSEYVFLNVQSVSGNKTAILELLYAFRDRYADVIGWDKKFSEPAMGANILNSRFEYLHVFSQGATRRIGTRPFQSTIDNVIVLQKNWGHALAGKHGAAFPMELAAWVIESFSQPGEIITDPCVGTGTTLIAAHRAGRICYAAELQPVYADLALTRWEQETGLPAALAP